MLDCKKVLKEINGDIEVVVIFLREKGIVKVVKKVDRIVVEGLILVVVKGNEVVLFELNLEIDFVVKNK